MKIVEGSTAIRDSLAMSRTTMANERTLLAYIRSGMTFVIAGVGVLHLIQDGIQVILGGCLLILCGIGFFYLGAKNYRIMKESLSSIL